MKKAGIEDNQNKLRFTRALHIIRLIKQFPDIAVPIATALFDERAPFEAGSYLLGRIQATAADDVNVMAYALEKLFSHTGIENFYDSIIAKLPDDAPMVADAKREILIAIAAVHDAEKHLEQVKASVMMAALGLAGATTDTGATAGTAGQAAPFLETAAAPSDSSAPSSIKTNP